ncbi:MAG: hypothetical protein KH392_08860 [Citrobacter freundii]|nr:hypothetical protein [Citrobacter freundii]
MSSQLIRAGTMERNVTLDFIRGVAILGILLLNISAFGLPKAAYLNPAWYGDITLSDAWIINMTNINIM